MGDFNFLPMSTLWPREFSCLRNSFLKYSTNFGQVSSASEQNSSNVALNMISSVSICSVFTILYTNACSSTSLIYFKMFFLRALSTCHKHKSSSRGGKILHPCVIKSISIIRHEIINSYTSYAFFDRSEKGI